MEPKEEKNSRSNEEFEEKQIQRICFIIQSKKRPRKSSKVWMNPYVKDLIINKEENTTQNERKNHVDEEEFWGFQSIEDFFKEKKQ